MLEYLIQLPSETLGYNVLGFLDMIDIIQLENAAASKKSQQVLKTILPYCPPILLESAKGFIFNRQAIIWCNKRRLRVQHAKISVELLCEVSAQYNVFGSIELYLNSKASCQDIESLKNSNINQRVTSVHIEGCEDQDPVVIEVLFLLLGNVQSLYIESSNLSQWMGHIRAIGNGLREMAIYDGVPQLAMITTVTMCCPYLEKLSLISWSSVSSSDILQCIANNCPHLRSLDIEYLDYNTSVEADADLTAFAEKCSQLEELSLGCKQLTDQSVIALAQHCSRVKKLKLDYCKLTAVSLIALSERGLPLEELFVPSIPIPSAEVASQCAHALSRIRDLKTGEICSFFGCRLSAIQYMTGLCELELNSSEDHLMVSHLLQLRCTGLEKVSIDSSSSITPQQLCELVTKCPQLCTVVINKGNFTTDAVLLELARSCPHLQEVTLCGSCKLTEKGVMALAVHCRQLRKIDFYRMIFTEETIRQLVQYCRRLTKLHVGVYVREDKFGCSMHYSSKEIRALRL